MRTFLFVMVFFLLSCNDRKEKNPIILTQASYFKAIGKNDIRLGVPKKGEWLFENKENGQNLEEYKTSNPVRPTADKSVIYLMPIGDFTILQQKALNLTRDYVELFFQQKTVLLKTLPDKIIPEYATRQREGNNMQLLAPYILDSLLDGKTPKDGIALLAISAKDLYHRNDWNYVFGLASYIKRVGVSSIYRLQDRQLDIANFKLCLSRLVSVSSHELGHMLTMQHCTFAKCVMNGSNSLREADLSPNRLCSQCQKKLYWNFKYDNKKRLKQLYEFCRKNGLQRDSDILKLDWKAVE